MYWRNVSKLAKELREDRVNGKEQFKYYLATLIAWNLIAQLFLYYGLYYCGLFRIKPMIEMALNSGIIVAFTIMSYRANKKGDNKDFIARMICLGFPVGICNIIFILITAPILIGTLTIIFHDSYPAPFEAFLGSFLWMYTLFYCNLLYGYFGAVAQGTELPKIKFFLK